jgi:TfoX/Sxy family transcriptional regulator of competence genes
MGQKGAKLTGKSTEAAEAHVGRLNALGDVTSRKMFALVDPKGGLFFKVNDSNREQYEEAGSKSYGKMPYFRVPSSVLDQDTQLREWAQQSMTLSKETKKR